ncbi:homeodomain superfamily [Paramecium bursaria]
MIQNINQIEDFKQERLQFVEQKINRFEITFILFKNEYMYNIYSIKRSKNSAEHVSNNTSLKDCQDRVIQIQEFIEQTKNLILYGDVLALQTNASIDQLLEYMETMLTSLKKLYQVKQQINEKNDKQTKGKRFTKKANLVLFQWLCKHFVYPYPTLEEQTQLAQKCQLTFKQVFDIMIRSNHGLQIPEEKSFRIQESCQGKISFINLKLKIIKYIFLELLYSESIINIYIFYLFLSTQNITISFFICYQPIRDIIDIRSNNVRLFIRDLLQNMILFCQRNIGNKMIYEKKISAFKGNNMKKLNKQKIYIIIYKKEYTLQFFNNIKDPKYAKGHYVILKDESQSVSIQKGLFFWFFYYYQILFSLQSECDILSFDIMIEANTN